MWSMRNSENKISRPAGRTRYVDNLSFDSIANFAITWQPHIHGRVSSRSGTPSLLSPKGRMSIRGGQPPFESGVDKKGFSEARRPKRPFYLSHFLSLPVSSIRRMMSSSFPDSSSLNGFFKGEARISSTLSRAFV